MLPRKNYVAWCVVLSYNAVRVRALHWDGSVSHGLCAELVGVGPVGGRCATSAALQGIDSEVQSPALERQLWGRKCRLSSRASTGRLARRPGASCPSHSFAEGGCPSARCDHSAPASTASILVEVLAR